MGTSFKISLNRSGYPRVIKNGVTTPIQTDPAVKDPPKLWVDKRHATNQITSAYARISSVCGASVETSRKAIKTVCKDLRNHNVYLSLEEVDGNDGVEVKSFTNLSCVTPSVVTSP